MAKSLKNLLPFFLLFFFLFLLPPVVLASSIPESVSKGEYNPPIVVEFGGFSKEAFQSPPEVACPAGIGPNCLSINWMSVYFAAIFRYGVGLAAILAAIMVLVGGFLWLTSAGAPDRINKAKDFIIGALIGLFLALFSVMILSTINPELVAMRPLVVPVPEAVTVQGETSDIEVQAFDSFKKNFISTLTPEQIAAGAGNISMQNSQVHAAQTIAGGDAYFTYDMPHTPELRRFLQQNAELRTSAPMPGLPDFINNTFFSLNKAFFYYEGSIYTFGTDAAGSPVIHVWANPLVSYFSHK